MKLSLLCFSLFISSTVFSQCNFNVRDVIGCVPSNRINITTSYLKYFLASKGYTYSASISDYTFDVVYACFSNSHKYPEKGVYLIQTDNQSSLQETYFAPNNGQGLYFQTLQEASLKVATCFKS